MTVDYIIPCICCEHPPSASDSVYYGMPVLRVSNSILAHKQFWTCECPVCKRGGNREFKSQYFALKGWNELQRQLYENAGLLVQYKEPFEDTCERLDYTWGEQLSFNFEDCLQ